MLLSPAVEAEIRDPPRTQYSTDSREFPYRDCGLRPAGASAQFLSVRFGIAIRLG
ncbi:MAG: hypothetical protein JSS42_10855 [Proteobacteria bacterium]|uniref:hypothetical protein n=1 Tax=Rudaea sp. TaxID=2136325 RepID=UPI0032206D71|nr:hypothetical protein [Pseudomonadota bacterium]